MNKITIVFSLFLVFLGMTACSLEELFEREEKLPQITPETRKAFGFLLDGKIWLPKGTMDFPTTM
ncbi:MAG: hypothetical protein HC892_22150 [Saprospiraceae bacterium]|nr:hypothetical protein [Saprospiraceae bacterium]